MRRGYILHVPAKVGHLPMSMPSEDHGGGGGVGGVGSGSRDVGCRDRGAVRA